MRRISILIAALLLVTGSASAGEVVSAAEFTERGRKLDFILDGLLVSREPPPAEGRTVLLLLDSTASLGRAEFPGALRSALLRNARMLARTRFAVARVGAPGPPVLEPTADVERIDAAVREILREPSSALQNVYGDLRRGAEWLASLPGRREITLVTLENGDAEDDLEGTVAALAAADVTVSVLAREAFLSDTWWFRRPRKDLGKLKLAGADSAFIELPWSYLLQWSVANEHVSSGFAMFGLSRVAGATGGKVWLYYPRAAARSFCGDGYLQCPLCRADHIPCGESYQAHRLRALAPLVGPRDEVGKIVSRDPCFQVVQSTWIRAAKKGVLMFEPSVDWAAGGLEDADLERGHLVLLGDSLAFGVQRKRAERLAKAADSVIRDLDRQLGHVGEEGRPRYRALVETTRVLLRLTAFNLRQFANFCEEVGPAWREGEEPEDWTPPEVPPLRSDYLYSRIWFTGLSLCHGIGPYREFRFPGGRSADQAFQDLRADVDAFFAKNAHTPFAQVLRRQGLIRCMLPGQPKGGVPAPRWVPSSASGGTTTQAPQRPARAGPSSGGSGGTATSGGR